MIVIQGSCFKRQLVRINFGKGLVGDIQYVEWIWFGGRLDNESKRQSGVKYYLKLRNLIIVSDSEIDE